MLEPGCDLFFQTEEGSYECNLQAALKSLKPEKSR